MARCSGEGYKNLTERKEVSGTAYKNKKDFKKAIQLFTKAIELNPDYKEAYLERAEVYRLIGEDEKAKNDEAAAARL